MALTIAQTLNLGTSFYSLLDFVGAWTLTDGTYLYNFTPPQAPSQHAITKIDPTGSMSVVGTWDFLTEFLSVQAPRLVLMAPVCGDHNSTVQFYTYTKLIQQR